MTRVFLRWVQQGIERRLKGFREWVQEKPSTFTFSVIGFTGFGSVNLWILTWSWIFGAIALGCLITFVTILVVVALADRYNEWKRFHPEELKKRKGKLIRVN